jgi:hypothetical protein
MLEGRRASAEKAIPMDLFQFSSPFRSVCTAKPVLVCQDTLTALVEQERRAGAHILDKRVSEH